MDLQSLNLSSCKKLKHINILRNIHMLNLCNSVNITTIIVSGNIHTLDLTYCEKIKDVSMLSNVHELNISKNVYGIHLLKKLLKILLFFGSNKTKISYGKKLNKYKKINNLPLCLI